MAEPDISWSPAHRAEADLLSPIRWVRWLIACLILLTLAFLAHTSGRFARLAMVETRHWVTTTSKLPAMSKLGVLGHLVPTSAPRSGASPGWLAPVGHARLTQAFGWHGSGSHAQFAAQATLHVPARAPVMAGVKATVTRLSQNRLTLDTQKGYQIAIAGVKTAGLHARQTVQPTTVIGRTDGTSVSITVTRDGYPVNPLGKPLYGSGWLSH